MQSGNFGRCDALFSRHCLCGWKHGSRTGSFASHESMKLFSQRSHQICRSVNGWLKSTVLSRLRKCFPTCWNFRTATKPYLPSSPTAPKANRFQPIPYRISLATGASRSELSLRRSTAVKAGSLTQSSYLGLWRESFPGVRGIATLGATMNRRLRCCPRIADFSMLASRALGRLHSSSLEIRSPMTEVTLSSWAFLAL